jgi:peroxiredoxin
MILDPTQATSNKTPENRMKRISKMLAPATALVLMSVSMPGPDLVPNKTVKKLDGSTASLHSILQQADFTVMTFWATWCVPCKKELENIKDLYPDWRSDYNAQVIAVSIDDSKTVAGVRPYVTTNDFDYIFLLDTNRELFLALNGTAPPLTIIANKEGKILLTKNKYVEGDEWILDEKLDSYSGS